MTKKEAIKLVTTEYDGLKKVDDKYKNDYEVVKQAINYWPYQIRYASNYLKANKELGLIAVKEDGCLISKLEYNLRNDDLIIRESLKQDGIAIKELTNEHKNNKEYIDIAIESNPYSILHINNLLITLEQAKKCVTLEPSILNYLTKEHKNNLELIKIADKEDSIAWLNQNDNEYINSNNKITMFDEDNNSYFDRKNQYLDYDNIFESVVEISDDQLPF